jgi:hypothetical protein
VETTFNKKAFAIAVTVRSPWLVDRAVNTKIGFHCDFVPHEKRFVAASKLFRGTSAN